MNPTTLPASSFFHQPNLIFGAGTLPALAFELNVLGIKRALLVTDQGLVAAGLVKKTVTACGQEVGVHVFDTVTENPVFSDVDRGTSIYAQQACDGVIALGGGSVIDTAKMIAFLSKNPGGINNYIGVPNALHGPSAPLIVIPTTAGTGSESSPSAGIHPDPSSPSVGMGSRFLVPRLAILDSDLTQTLPKRLVAATGIDTLSHCIEGYFSKKTIPFGKSMALEGIQLVSTHLKNAVNYPKDETSRAQMMLAAFAGGRSIGMGLGPAHAIAIACSDQGYHHGILSGIGLIATLQLTCAQIPEKAREVAQAMGLQSGVSVVKAIEQLIRDLELPCNLFELKYVCSDLTKLAELVHKSHFNLFAPYHPTNEEYRQMLGKSLHLN